VLDATDAWSEAITDESKLAGIPESGRAVLRAYAEEKRADGWLVTLKQPSVQAVLSYADDRALRERVYRAYQTRASDQGPNANEFDNSARIENILALRHEAAQLLGFRDAAEESLATKMAPSSDAVLAFLHDLAAREPVALRELDELRAFARDELGLPDLQAWDVPYAAEKLRERKYALNEEELKPYFALDAVIDGLFAITQRVFGVSLRRRVDVDVWHPDVRYYDLVDESGRVFAGAYVDLYARSGKRGGAWMDVCVNRFRRDGVLQQPVAFLTCNFAPPTATTPSLLTHDDVLTLFHEFGHGLHHLLTEVDLPGVGGINGVEWDAVELPSQFMENFGWLREALDLFARHWQTGEKLPDELFARMQAARHFHAGLFLVRQLEFGLFDFRIHREFDPARGARAMETLSECATKSPSSIRRNGSASRTRSRTSSRAATAPVTTATSGPKCCPPMRSASSRKPACSTAQQAGPIARQSSPSARRGPHWRASSHSADASRRPTRCCAVTVSPPDRRSHHSDVATGAPSRR
jgi:oligopeptidase A